MESSFFEYRDTTGVESESDTEIIDDSLVEEKSFTPKTKWTKHKTVVAESEESTDGELSPEIVPKRRPPTRKSIDSDSSFIGRKVKKRIMLIDSDTENSIIIEHDRHNKLKCVKATPLKITSNKNGIITDDDGTEYESDDSTEDVPNDSKHKNDDRHKSDENQNSDVSEDDDDENCEEEEYEVDDDQMVMSRATRMSIMGVIPKDDDSDESDIIQSDDSNIKSRTPSLHSNGSTNYADLPDVSVAMNKTPQKTVEDEPDSDSSKITCSPLSSPSKDITAEIDESPVKNKPKVLTNNNNNVDNNKDNMDDDVIIYDNKTEIITLSSDDEDEMVVKKPVTKKSPNVKRSPKPKEVKDVDLTPFSNENTIKQYIAPKRYPNQIVYVKKHVKENELNKLNSLKEDLQSIRYLLENMDMDNLPDGGAKLVERLSGLEAQVRAQGDKVANMVVEPEKPSAEDIAKDGFDKGLSWDDIKKASNAVQPRMFGKQAMSTHMAERNLILDRLRDLYESLGSRPPESEEAVQPKSLVSTLMQHQLHALAWLAWRETQNPAGGILADDMGLGKTITMIALIATDKENKIDHGDDDDDDDETGNSKLIRGGTLVVCPASLLQQWAGEVSTHCSRGALSVCAHHGAARTQHAHRLAHHDIVITTYNILLRDHEKNGVLTRVLWHRVILDEAHAVRNYKSATSLSVCGLRSRRRWCLTGTPVQNKDLDLFALLKFLRCTPFDDLTMWKKWIDNKSMGGQERLSAIMRCILLRRTKQQLQQKGQLNCLPKRDTHMCEVTLTKEEMNVYQKVLVFSKTLFAQFLHQRAEKSADQMGTPPNGKDSAYYSMHKKMIALQGGKPVKSHEILVLLLRLRQVCCHCGLIAAMLDPELADNEPDEQSAQTDLLDELNKLSIKEYKADKNKEDEEEGLQEEGTSVAEAIRSVLSPNNPVFKMDRNSSKIKAVMECLEKNVLSVPGEKAVVVSQWTSVLDLVSSCLSARHVPAVTLHGGVPVPARQALVNQINDPNSKVKVMLLSLCAGGVGLNLCGANHLLLLDPHWNPQLEEQAQDRIYRVGQTKHVHIYRFMCVDTVEQSIRKLQLAKLELADNVLTGARNNNASKLTIEDLKMLFNMGST